MKKINKSKLSKNKKIILFLMIVLIIFILISNGDKIEEKKEIKEGTDKYAQLRKNMVEQQLKARDINDEKVLSVMGKIERHNFVPDV